MEGKQGPEKDGDLPLVPQQAHRAFSLSDICCSAELSSKEPDFNIEPPTRRPALAATFRFCPDRHSCMACLLMSRTLGGGGHLGPHWGEEEAAVGNGTDKKQAAARRALLTPDREKREGWHQVTDSWQSSRACRVLKLLPRALRSQGMLPCSARCSLPLWHPKQQGL